MNRSIALNALALFLAIGVVSWATTDYAPKVAPNQSPPASGYVYLDANRNRIRDPGERGLAGIRVSNQSLIVRTDRNGRWEMPAEPDEDTVYYVVKPRGYMTPVDAQQIPKFYYVHKPKGSPPSKYPGLAPTGPLPASIDFPLVPNSEPSAYEMFMFGDTQPRDVREVDYLRHDIVEPIGRDHGKQFGVTLGDVVFDDLDVFDPLVKTVGVLGVPWFNVPGNHDTNQDSDDDLHSDETWERLFGPNYYSFDYGPVHFVVLDDIEWRKIGDRRTYRGGLGGEQLAWIARDLSLVPKSQLVVFMMHIPIVEVVDRESLFRLIEDRPNTISVSAHTHYQEHIFLGLKHGWKGKQPHHHINNATTCGSWWQGAPDEVGIPHTTMRDGAPNGYSIFRFDGNRYRIQFRPARRPAEYQMEIHAPDEVPAGEAAGLEILANVFAGSERSKVEMRVEGGPWQTMLKVSKIDPVYAQTFERDKTLKAPFRPSPAPIECPHMWSGRLPSGLMRGLNKIQVRTTDQFGQNYEAVRGITIR